jgi:3-oxoacyl-[acyl-carrier protein] reductase
MEGKTFAADALEDQLILVTGASSGIGAATARLAAAVGADVAVAYHEQLDGAEATAAAVRALGRRAEIFEADLSDPVAARVMVGSAIERMGTIDGLVNNAGIMPQSPFLEISDAEWSRVIATDLTAAFACSQAVLPGMLERGRGSIVMISSRLGQIGFAGVAHYAAAKAGVMALAKSIAREYGTQGVRANAVAPGVVITDMTSADVVTGEVGQRRLAELPLGRFGRPDEIADAVVFLLSDASSLFLGQTLGANSGGFMP